jgi:lipoprotein-anchoring transpeptidase ErfK/SrfK
MHPLLMIFIAIGSLLLGPMQAQEKHVEIDKTRQVLRAFEGSRLILECHVSTGRWNRSTPAGHFTAGVKSRMHYSRLYHNAPMPYSVQVTGNIFIHGFAYVPPWPDSHGCIRLPLDGDNPAKKFFQWIEPGTPIHIFGQWNGPPKKPGRAKPASP